MEFYIPGPCVPKGRPRVTWKSGKAFAYTPKRTREYANLAKAVVISQMNEAGYSIIPKDKPVRILMEFYLNRKITAVPDIDNLQKQCLDFLKGTSYENDSQVVELLARKIKGPLPMTKIVIEEV